MRPSELAAHQVHADRRRRAVRPTVHGSTDDGIAFMDDIFASTLNHADRAFGAGSCRTPRWSYPGLHYGHCASPRTNRRFYDLCGLTGLTGGDLVGVLGHPIHRPTG